MTYKVSITKLASKELRELPKNLVPKVFLKIQSLAEDPRPHGCKKLEGYREEFWRVRVGDYRIIYTIEDEIRIVEIRQIGNRRDVYK